MVIGIDAQGLVLNKSVEFTFTFNLFRFERS